LEKREIGEVHNKITFTQDSTVILPWLLNACHFIVVIINFKTKECYIMDPFNPYDTESRLAIARFKQVFKILKSDVMYGNDRQQCPPLSHIRCPLKKRSTAKRLI